MSIHTSRRSKESQWVPAIERYSALPRAEKFYLMRQGQYLHQAGLHMQTGRRWAWTGTVEQARAMRLKADAAVGCILVSADDPFLVMQEGA